jgi:hypothetical protein
MCGVFRCCDELVTSFAPQDDLEAVSGANMSLRARGLFARRKTNVTRTSWFSFVSLLCLTCEVACGIAWLGSL